jgi:pimeloyl-ACP methyl ester carboxylesterase
LLYTSGSTGAPKGVEVCAGALAQQCEASASTLALDEHDQQLLFSSLAFDASLEQWLAPLMRGATVHVMAETWSPTRLLAELAQRGLTRLDLPPAYALTAARELEQADSVLSGSLRSCTVGGEAIGASDLARVLQRLRPQRLHNAYGPTEAVITPTVWSCAQQDELPHSGYAPIGRPLAGRTAYVLDAWFSPLPDGAIGELYLGGEPLARGYRAEPARTSERFLPDPFAGHGARMLRTGDLVRKRADGVLEFVGRGDEQLKIRGFRVELGEVQSALLRHPGVQEAAVIAHREGKEAELLAYAVAPASTRELLLAHLREVLPTHAVPAQLTLLAALPRTSSGKLDARALPTPLRAARVHVPPRSERERQLATAFADVLELAQVSIHDNFFELGGHSLRALTLVSQIERSTGQSVRLADILANPSVEGLARVLDHKVDGARSPLVRLNAAPGDAPLFCLHPAGGAAFAYTELARKLAADKPVYGLVCRSLLDAQFRDHSLAQMAEDYAREILSVQASGPFSLLGWSLGGAIALAVAAALEARGHRVSFLGFVDGFVPGFDDRDEAEEREPARELDPSVLAQFQERAQAEQTLAHLTALSRAFELPTLRIAPHCWWSDEGRALRREVLARLGEGLGQCPRFSVELATSHEQIVRHPAFLASLRQELAAIEARAEGELQRGRAAQ